MAVCGPTVGTTIRPTARGRWWLTVLAIATCLTSCSASDGTNSSQPLEDCKRMTDELALPGPEPTANEVHRYCVCLLELTPPDADSGEAEVRAFVGASERCKEELR